MMPTTHRKVDADEYMPEIGDWEDPDSVLYQFDNGWQIREATTRHDRALASRLTLTCCTTMESQIWSGPTEEPTEEEIAAKRAELERTWSAYFSKDNQAYATQTEKYLATCCSTRVERDLASWHRASRKGGHYKLLYMTDTEQRPRCIIVMALAKALDGGYVSYGTSRDLGQEHPIEVGGEKWHLLEARLGTGAHAPKVCEPLLVEWYSKTTGEWNQDTYETAVKKRPYYGAVGSGDISQADVERIRALRDAEVLAAVRARRAELSKEA